MDGKHAEVGRNDRPPAHAGVTNRYQPAIREELNQKVKFLMQIEKNTEDVVGRRALLALHVNRNSGVGSRAEYGALPTAGAQGYTDANATLKYHYGRMAISGPVIKAMATDRGSFDRAMRSETTNLVKDLKRNLNRQVFGTSDGVIATVQAASASTTVTLATTSTTVQARQLEAGMVVDIGPISTNPQGSAVGVQIVSVSSATPAVVTFNQAVTVGSGDAITLSGSGGNSSSTGQKEVTGLQTIVLDSGTLFGVNPSTYPVWKSTNDNNGGTLRSISEQLVAKNQQKVEIASGEEITQLWSSDGVHRAYANLLTSLKRFPNTVELKGGYGGLEVTAGGGSVALVWDRDCPANTMYGLNTSHLIEFYSSDWEWMDNDGAVLSRVPNTDAYEATLFKYMEVATDFRASHFVIKDITEA